MWGWEGLYDSVAQFGAHVRTSGRLALLQASKARERPLATGRPVLLARTQPTVDAHQIDGRRDLQVVQMHFVLPPAARLAQSLGADPLRDGGFDPRTSRILLLKSRRDLLPSSLRERLLHRLTCQRQTASIRTARTARPDRADLADGFGKLDHRDGLAALVVSLGPALRAMSLRTARHLRLPLHGKVLGCQPARLPTAAFCHRPHEARA